MLERKENEEENLKIKVLAGQATLAEGLALYAQFTARGEAFTPDLEEAVLKLGLSAEPHRQDMIARMRFVLTAQGKHVPEEIEQAFAKHAAEHERSRDHQKDAYEYNRTSDFKDMEEGFFPIYERCRTFSMTSIERMYALYQSVKYIVASGIDGDFVECGVWRGGSMMLIAHTLIELGATDRKLFLFDTYEGLPKPDEIKDIDIWGNRAIDGWLPNSVSEEKSHWAEAREDEVRSNLATTGYPITNMHFIKGMVERTIPDMAPLVIALLRLDTDWYISTKHELINLYDRLKHHGILIIDDYGHFKGARHAVDEFFSERNIVPLMARVDYSGRLLIKVQ